MSSAIPAGAAGVLTGALILYFLQSKPRRAALVSVVVNVLLVPATFTFLLYCHSSVITGINSDYPGGYVVKRYAYTMYFTACNRQVTVCG